MPRWFNSYHRDDEKNGPHSTGVRLADDVDRLWWQSKHEGRALPPSWAPVQAITSRFVYSPYTTASLVYVDCGDIRELRHRVRRHAASRARVYDLVFRPLPLPLAMLL